MNLAWAIEKMKEDKKVRSASWGKEQYIYLDNYPSLYNLTAYDSQVKHENGCLFVLNEINITIDDWELFPEISAFRIFYSLFTHGSVLIEAETESEAREKFNIDDLEKPDIDSLDLEISSTMRENQKVKDKNED